MEFDDLEDLWKSTEDRHKERGIYHIREAHERKDAVEYYNLCNEYGIYPHDKELYKRGRKQQN